MTEEKIAKINEYARRVKASLTGHLDNTYLVDKDGAKEKLKKKKY